MRCGASGYLLKSSAVEEMLCAIQLALKGKTYVTPQIRRGMQKSFIKNPGAKGQANGPYAPAARSGATVGGGEIHERGSRRLEGYAPHCGVPQIPRHGRVEHSNDGGVDSVRYQIKNIGSVKSTRESRNKAWRFNHSLNAASLTLCF